MWRLTLASSCLFLQYQILLSMNVSDQSEASSQLGILMCSETLVSDVRHMLELLHMDLFYKLAHFVIGEFVENIPIHD